jgi:hypothetical protein
MKEGAYLEPRRYHSGMARQCSRSHDGTKPGDDADDTSARHSTTPAHDTVQGKAGQLGEKLEVAMAETLDAGGDGAEDTGKQLVRSHGQAGAPSRDLPSAPPSQWLAPAGVAGIERGGGDPVARARVRGEERGGATSGRVESDRATCSRSTRWAGADRWARGQQVGPGYQLVFL